MKPDLAHWAQLLNLLASAYRTAPETVGFTPIGAFFRTPDWPELWPGSCDNLISLQAELAQQDEATLLAAWKRLFVGPASLPAPPWGSVWLDEEKVLQGDSTLRLMAFLRTHNMALHTECPEPVDHIGLMLFQAAWLAMENRPAALSDLIDHHFLSWLPLYVDALNAAEAPGFYRALGELTLITLRELQCQLPGRIL